MTSGAAPTTIRPVFANAASTDIDRDRSDVLFRRDRLAAVNFRWEPGRCECRCCCDDLRRDGHGIGYLSTARAWHRPDPARAAHRSTCPIQPPSAPDRPRRILSAFDRGHYERFRRQFLTSLRASGNAESVTAVTYGLHPDERARLEAAGVEVASCRDPGIGPAPQRVRDFPRVIARWPEDTPVAYWDAADVIFQGRLVPLWDLVRAHPGKILAAREPVEIGGSPVLGGWTATIHDPEQRRRTREIFYARPFVNAGFAAGTARALLDYFGTANRLLDTALVGVGPWGHQVAMNLYLHTNPGTWQEVPDAWNYCLSCRDPHTYGVVPTAPHPSGLVDTDRVPMEGRETASSLPSRSEPTRKAPPVTPETSPPDPAVVLDLLEAFRRSKVMFAAVSLGIFDALEERPLASSELAEALSLHPDALARLLDTAVALKLLERRGDSYANTPAASAYLCKTSPSRLTGYINYSNNALWKLWGNLEGAIREGTHRWKETFGWDGPIFSSFFHTEDDKREFLMGMHGYGLMSSPKVVAAFDLGRYRRLVDLGGATGHLAIAACRHYPGLRAAVFDLPAAVPLAKEIVGASPVADRIDIIAGDFFVDELPEADVYALGRILHDWSEDKCLTLLRRIHDRLPSGGALLIAEKLIDEDRSGPIWAHMQNLGMLLYTEGRERTLGEYEALLKKVGFAGVRGSQTPSPADAVLAVKA